MNKRTLLALIAVLIYSVGAFAQTQPNAAAMPFTKSQFFTSAGAPLVGGKLYFYTAGTSSAEATYTTSCSGVALSMCTQNSQPVTLDSSGRANIFLGPVCYKIIAQNSLGTQQWTEDNICDLALLQKKVFDNVRICTQFAGATAGDQISACMADLPSTGGIADANGFQGAQSISADIFTAVSKSVQLLVSGATFGINAPTTVPSNIQIVMSQGAVFSVAPGQTFTMNGSLEGSSRSFHFSGSGSTTLNNQPSIYPEWFATGAGNAGLYIAKAFSAAPSTGGTVDASGLTGSQTCTQDMFSGISKPINLILGPTTLSVSVGQTIPAAKIQIIGVGRASIVRATAATFDVFTVTGDDPVFDNFSIEGAATSDATTQFGIFTATASPALRGTVRDMFFGGPSSVVGLNNGIKLDDGNLNWNIHDNTFRYMIGAISGTGYGVLLGAANFARIHSNIFFGTTGGGLSRGRHAIYLSSGLSYSDISDNIIDGMNSSSISIFATALQTAIAYNVVHHNSITGQQLSTDGSAGIELAANAHDNWIDDNSIISPGRTGIIVNDLLSGGLNTSNHIRNNHIYSAGYFGIECRGCKYTEIAGNSIFDSSSASVGTYDGILVAAVAGVEPANQVKVFGNFIRSSTPTYRNAIELNATAPGVANTEIRDNSTVAGTVGNINTNSQTATICGNFTGNYVATVMETCSLPTNFAARTAQAMGAAVSSAGDLTLGIDGVSFFISGSTTINAITTANWQAGSVIYLVFTGSPTVKNNTAGGGGTAPLLLSGSTDFLATPNDTLSLLFNGTNWIELARTVVYALPEPKFKLNQPMAA